MTKWWEPVMLSGKKPSSRPSTCLTPDWREHSSLRLLVWVLWAVLHRRCGADFSQRFTLSRDMNCMVASSAVGSGRALGWRGGQGGTSCGLEMGTRRTPDTRPWRFSLLAQHPVKRGPKRRLRARKFCLFPCLCSLSPFKQKSAAFRSHKQLAGGSCFPRPHQLPATDVQFSGFSGCFSGVLLLLVTASAWSRVVQH